MGVEGRVLSLHCQPVSRIKSLCKVELIRVEWESTPGHASGRVPAETLMPLACYGLAANPGDNSLNGIYIIHGAQPEGTGVNHRRLCLRVRRHARCRVGDTVRRTGGALSTGSARNSWPS